MAPKYSSAPFFFVHYEEIICPTCKGEGHYKCGMCGGTGRRKVSNSSSSGSSTYQSLPNVSSYPSRSSTDNTSRPTYTQCPICGGSGVCTSCGGTGGKWEDVGYYVGSDTKSWIKCPSCNGNKRCYNCHGSGRQ